LPTCSICKKEKPENEFYRKISRQRLSGGVEKIYTYFINCKECDKQRSHKDYKDNSEARKLQKRDYYLSNKSEIKRKTMEYDEKRYIEAIIILGGKCSICGEEDIDVLQIHHRHMFDKSNKNKREGRHATIARILKGDIKEFELLCANCHVRVTKNEMREMWKRKYSC
jgi:hypothetical protein